jgi:hypothetical protein
VTPAQPVLPVRDLPVPGDDQSLLIIGTGVWWRMTRRRGDAGSGSYDQAHKLRRGRQLWTGNEWAEVTAVRVTGEGVLITVADGRVFRAGYADAVLSRVTPPATLTGAARAARRAPSFARGLAPVAAWPPRPRSGCHLGPGRGA